MSNETTVTNAYISTKQAAFLLDVSTSTLKNWRTRELFGCPFFTADKKFGDTWYYLRERVEQLKEVYQKGILQSMYKLARKFSDNFQKSVPSHKVFDNLTNDEELLYPDFEVAEILGVSEMTLLNWRKQKIFVEDSIDHLDCFWYKAERVYQFQKTYKKQKFQNSLTESRDQLKQILNSFIDNAFCNC